MCGQGTLKKTRPNHLCTNIRFCSLEWVWDDKNSHGGPDFGPCQLNIKSNKTLSWPPTDQSSASNKNNQSQAIKTASLDHITKQSVLSSSPPKCLLCRYETSWNEEKETQWPVLREREKKQRRGRVNQMRTGSRLSLQCPPLCHWSRQTPSNVGSLLANIPLLSSGHHHSD